MEQTLLLPFLCTLLISGCAWNAAGSTGCEPTGMPLPLPGELEEVSGVAWSVKHPDILWSHNDGGHEVALYALDGDGHLLATLPLEGVRNRDWEDVSVAPCGDRSCIYVADTGDNEERRRTGHLLRVEEPEALDGGSARAESFPIRYPDGPRDVEALYVLPGEEVFLVTKGRNDPIAVYRYPPPLRSGQTVELEEIQTLSAGPVPIPDQVTGADASADGSLVVLRTYQTLTFHRVRSHRLVLLEGGTVYLRTLAEPQGEGVGIGPEGRLALTTEAGIFGGRASLRILECDGLHEPGIWE